MHFWVQLNIICWIWRNNHYPITSVEIPQKREPFLVSIVEFNSQLSERIKVNIVIQFSQIELILSKKRP